MDLLPKEKERRTIIKQNIIDEYNARKAKYPIEIPDYVKATRVNLDLTTFRKIVGYKNMLQKKELDEFFKAEKEQKKKIDELIEAKRKLVA